MSFIQREADGGVFVVEGPFSADTQLMVNADDVVVAFRDGAVLGSLGPGRHAPGTPFDLAVFVSRTPQTFRLMHPIGESARAFGSVRFQIDEPMALLGAVSDPRSLSGEGLQEAVLEAAQSLVERAVHGAHEGGVSLEAMAADPAQVFGPATAEWPVPGSRIDLSELSLSVMEAEASEPEEEAEASLLGASVTVPLANGRRARGIVEEQGYLVRFPNGEAVWVAVSDLEIAEDD